mgnify:CR=1 FL=1
MPFLRAVEKCSLLFNFILFDFVILASEELLKFYMGKNTPDRQNFIIDNLKVEKDLILEEVL